MKNKSDVSVMLKEAGILFAITLVAGLLLGLVHEITAEPIQIQQEKAIKEACMAVFASAGDETIEFREMDYTPDASLSETMADVGVTVGTVYEAETSDGTFFGYVVEAASSQGYGGDIVLYVGVTSDGTVSGVSILELSETAGLGMEAPSVLVPQFAGKKVESFSYTKTGSRTDSEVDAISGATITTKAVVNAVNGGLETARMLLQGGGANE
jgi:electron transport complex protein RnfG